MTNCSRSSGEVVLRIVGPNKGVYAFVGSAFLVELLCSPSRATVGMCGSRWNILTVVEKDLVVAYRYDS